MATSTEECNLVVRYAGDWKDDKYTNYNSVELCVNATDNFMSFFIKIREKIGVELFPDSVRLLFIMDMGVNTSNEFELKQDNDINWLFRILRTGKFCGCFMVFDAPLGISEIQFPDIFGVVGKSTGNYDDSVIEVENDRLFDMVEVEKYPISFEIKVGNRFVNKTHMKRVIQLFAMRNRFDFRVDKSDKHRYVLGCHHESCNWYIRAVKYVGCESWVVRKIRDKHTCGIDVVLSESRQASPNLVSAFVRSKIHIGRCLNVAPRDIMNEMRVSHGVHLSYLTAWRSREIAYELVCGTAEESYSLIPSICHVIIEKNPGSVALYETDSIGRFKYFFLCLKACISGSLCCRPVISIDGTYLKHKYFGTLLTACMLDGNNQIFPLGFAIVDNENDESWEWFLSNLKNALGDREDLVIISDRHVSIHNAVRKVFPDAEHGLCMQHLWMNLKNKFKRPEMSSTFYRCAKAYTLLDFEMYMSELEGFVPCIRNVLQEVGFHKWARAFFLRSRYKVMTTNISESFNSLMKDARELPIVPMILYLRELMQKWFYERKVGANNLRTLLTSWAEFEVLKELERGRSMEVSCYDVYQFEVQDGGKEFFVDIMKRSCSCRKWDTEEYPCSHACAALSSRNLKPVSFVHHFYTKNMLIETYAGLVYPIGKPCQWIIPEEVKKVKVLPPTTKRSIGRPKKQRIASIGEFKMKLKCGRCGRIGHNRKTCKFPIPL